LKVTEFVENMINPSLASHGGWVEVTGADETTGVIEMKMGGGCHGCGASASTMQYGIQTALMEEFPQIAEVVDVTDHATGENPFFMGNPFAGM
jgi:Fe/S biogenesis protein NfuA